MRVSEHSLHAQIYLKHQNYDEIMLVHRFGNRTALFEMANFLMWATF